MRSVEPSSSVTDPPPPQTPGMPAKGPPDCAWLALLHVEAASTVANANTARRVRLLRDFLSIPLPPSGTATELAVRICTIDRYQHKSLATDRASEGLRRSSVLE